MELAGLVSSCVLGCFPSSVGAEAWGQGRQAGSASSVTLLPVQLLPSPSSPFWACALGGYLPLGWWHRPVGLLLPAWFPALLPSH